MRNWLLSILMALVLTLPLSSQELEWSVNMNAVFNNREGGNRETPDQTFIFTRITPQIGVSMDSAHHRIMGGVTWYQPMNDHLHGYKVLPALYYQFHNQQRGLSMAIGMIPDALRISRFLQSDSMNYVNPNINGFLINIEKPHFSFLSWLNWRQFRTNNRREAFDVTGQAFWHSGNYGYNRFQAGGTARYNHLAKSFNSPEGEGVVDNVILNPSFGFTHYGRTRLRDFFSIKAGVLLSIDRDRPGENKWLSQAGFMGDIEGRWRWLSLQEHVYVGKRQMPLYDKYGPLLYQGDQFYHNKFYSRTDVGATIFERDFVNVEARLTFIATDKTTAFWQQVSARFYLDNKIWKRNKQPKSFDNHNGIISERWLPAQF